MSKCKHKETYGLYVKVRNDNVEEALKRLKRKLKKSNILFELVERKYYKKPSQAKREKRLRAIARNKNNKDT